MTSLFGVWDPGSGIRDMGSGIWDLGCCIWCVVWDMGYVVYTVLASILQTRQRGSSYLTIQQMFTTYLPRYV